MALAGTLRDFSLADIFQLISFQRKTGVLMLKSATATVTVSVINGAIVSADSLPKRIDDHLGQVLVKKGLITSDQLEKALVTQQETMQKMGYILTRSNFITTEALKEALQTQILQIIYRLFKWDDGEYEFTQADSVEYDKEFISPIQIENVLMEGMRMLDEWPIIRKKVSSLDMVFKREIGAGDYVVEGGDDLDFSHGPQAGGKLRLSPNEHLVFQLVDGICSVQVIIDKSRLTEFDTCRALYDLQSRNLISDTGAQMAVSSDREKAVEFAVEARRDYTPVLTWIIAGVSVLSFFVGLTRPFGVFYALTPPMLNFQEAHRTARFSEMMRIAESVRVYYLHIHSLPTNLVSLQELDLVTADQLLSDGRQKYDLDIRDGTVILREHGVENPLSVEVTITARTPAQPPNESPPIP
ncbi:MAG: DUF4388 domain-containing protein [Acidobacteriota bacterium]